MTSLNRADLHIHTTYSDGLLTPEDAVNYAVSRTILRVIAITDHNTLDGAQQAYEYWHHHREEFGQIEVIVGEEVSSRDGHILGLFLHEAVPPHLSAADTVYAIHAQGGLAIAAHPFTHLLEFTGLKGVGRQIADLPLDGVEVRNSVPTEAYSNLITSVFNARHRRHALVGSSDCHYLPMLGRTYTLFEGHTAEDLRSALDRRATAAGGFVNGPRSVVRFVRDQLLKRRLPLVLPDDHHYRRSGADLTVDVEELRRDTAMLHCSGSIVAGNADVLKTEVNLLLVAGLRHLIVDLANVTFVDSAGLGALIAVQKRTEGVGGRMVLCRATRGVHLLLQLAGLDEALLVRETVPQALAVLSATSG